jgi:chromosome segregation ATPase
MSHFYRVTVRNLLARQAFSRGEGRFGQEARQAMSDHGEPQQELAALRLQLDAALQRETEYRRRIAALDEEADAIREAAEIERRQLQEYAVQLRALVDRERSLAAGGVADMVAKDARELQSALDELERRFNQV